MDEGPRDPEQLTVACALVYSIEISLGIITLLPGIMPNQLTAVLLLIFGASVFFLAWCIHVASHRYSSSSAKMVPDPSQPKGGFILLRETSLTVGDTFNIYQGSLMIILGILVLFMILGIFPSFNSDGQLGLLLGADIPPVARPRPVRRKPGDSIMAGDCFWNFVCCSRNLSRASSLES